MTVEPGHSPAEGGNVPRPQSQSTPAAQPLHYHSARHGSHVDESPDLLRWRADLLMDEMMMGGVDVSAADGNRTFSGVEAPVVQRSQPRRAMEPVPGEVAGSGAPREPHSEPYRREGGENGHVTNGRANGHSNGHSNDLAHPQDRRAAEPGDKYPPANSPVGRASDRSVDGSHRSSYVAPRSDDAQRVEPFAPESFPSEPYSSEPYRSPQRGERDDLRRDAHSQSTGGAPLNEPASYESQRTSPAAFDLPTRPTYPPVDRSVPERFGPDDNADGRDGRGIAAPRRYPDQSPGVAPETQRSSGYSEEPREYTRPDERLASRGDDNEIVGQAPSYPPTLRTTMDSTPPVRSGDQLSRADRLYSVEEQYEPFRREQGANVQPVEPERPATRPPLPPVEPPRQPSSPPRVKPQPVDEHTQWATGADKWEYQDFSADPEQEEEEDSLLGGYPTPPRRNEAVRHDSAEFVSAMSVVGTNKKRSTLLPRSTELDVDTLHHEISDLHGQIAALLPVGNETSERARHLLDKAYSILQSDPSRSAEVEYYMQQVRTIVSRLHQARQWSDLYRQRLQTYLSGWLGLSAMVLLARFVFQIDLEDALMWLTGLSLDSWLVAHWATFVGTAAAGSFGGALGALYTMQKHARGEHSFFDRKYGLRGLILPFMGLIVGAFGYIIFGLVFALVGINPSQSLVAAIIPTMSALAFGFSQESIYGTRN